MKDFDLESKIKSVRVPERDGEFWQTLPRRVLAKAQAAPEARPPAFPSPPSHYSLFTILNSKFVLAVLLLGLCLWQSRMPQAISRVLLKDGREMRQALAQFPSRLDTLMRDEHGLHNLILDPP
jgi:hypothetical protein